MASLDQALDLARRGFRIFPLGDDCKPEFTGWPERATTDEAQIRAWWLDPVLEWEQDRNVGIACGQGLQVVDLDEKQGRNGIANFTTVEDVQGEPVPPTFTVRTPSGGIHKFLKVDGAYGNTAGRIATGIDTRGDGGYVVGPGSEKPGGRYEIIEDAPLAQAPQWLLGYLAPYQPPADHREIMAELDTPYAVMRTIEMLREAPAVSEAGIGNNATFVMAAKVKDMGVSRDTAVMLMEQYWNSRSDFARSLEELRYVIGNAYRHGRNAPGALDPVQEFGVVTATNERKGLHYVRFEDAKADTSAPYLIDGLIDQGAMSVLYGDSNSGKTFIALDLSHHIATGRDWRGKRVRRGMVVYVAAEGGRSIRKRLAALRGRYGAQDVDLVLVPCPVDLLRTNGDTSKLIELIREAETEYGEQAALVVIDTLSRAMAGGNENAPDDMGSFVLNVDKIRAAVRAHVLIVHHTGKDAAKGARGHSLLRAATDTEIEVADRTISVTKQRDMDYGEPFPFDLEVVTVGATDEGAAITSCIVKYPAKADVAMTPDMKLAIESLQQACADVASERPANPDGSQQHVSVTFSCWAAVFRAKKGTDKGSSRNAYADKVLRTLRTIADKNGWIGITERNQYFIP